MSSRSLGAMEAWRPWISRGPLRDASISRAAPGARRREVCPLVRLPRRVARNLRRAEVESATCTPDGDEGAQEEPCAATNPQRRRPILRR